MDPLHDIFVFCLYLNMISLLKIIGFLLFGWSDAPQQKPDESFSLITEDANNANDIDKLVDTNGHVIPQKCGVDFIVYIMSNCAIGVSERIPVGLYFSLFGYLFIQLCILVFPLIIKMYNKFFLPYCCLCLLIAFCRMLYGSPTTKEAINHIVGEIKKVATSKAVDITKQVLKNKVKSIVYWMIRSKTKNK